MADKSKTVVGTYMAEKYFLGPKTVVGTYRKGIQTVYVPKCRNVGYGRQLVIDVHRGYDSNFSMFMMVQPTIPYRILLGDYNFLSSDPHFTVDQPTDDSGNLIFNGGFTIQDGLLHSDTINSSNQNYFEFSFTRSSINHLLNKDIIMQNKSNGEKLIGRFTEIYAYDLNPRLQVISEGDIDHLLISCVTRISATTEVNIENRRVIENWDYSIPVALLYNIDIMNMRPTTPPNIFYPGVTTTTRINNDSGDVYTNLDIIPKLTSTDSWKIPFSTLNDYDTPNGCDCDIYMDSDNAFFATYFTSRINNNFNDSVSINIFQLDLSSNQTYSFGDKSLYIPTINYNENDYFIPTKISVGYDSEIDTLYYSLNYIGALYTNYYSLNYIDSLNNYFCDINYVSTSVDNSRHVGSILKMKPGIFNTEINNISNNIYFSYFDKVSNIYKAKVDNVTASNILACVVNINNNAYQYNNVYGSYEILTSCIDKSRMSRSLLDMYFAQNSIPDNDQTVSIETTGSMKVVVKNHGYVTTYSDNFCDNKFPVIIKSSPAGYICYGVIINEELSFIFSQSIITLGSNIIQKWNSGLINNLYNGINDGNSLYLTLTGCSGIFSGTMSREPNYYMNIDYTKTNPNLNNFILGGIDSSNYWALFGKNIYYLDMAVFSMTYNDGFVTKDLINHSVGTHNVFATNYSGKFNLDIITSVNADGLTDPNGVTFDHSEFLLPNVAWSLYIYDCHNEALAFSSGTFNLQPPVFNATIDPSDNKSIYNSIFYYWERDANAYMKNNIVNVCFPDGNIDTIRLPDKVLPSDLYAGTFNIPTIGYSKGTKIYIDSTISLQNTSRKYEYSSDPIVYCKGHKYSISDVTVTQDSLDITDKFSESNITYILSPVESSIDIGCTFSLSHEQWNTGLDDIKTYPKIKTISLAAVSITNLPSINIKYKEEDINKINTTYPNCKSSFGYAVLALSSFIHSDDVSSSNFTELTDYTISITIDVSGRYYLFIVITDEFEQKSVFCITNVSRYYHIPFKG